MSEGGFFALRVEPGEPGIVNVPDDLTLTISHVAAAPDAGTTRLSLVTTDYTGATAAAHLLTLQPKKQDHALVDLSFPPGEAVTFAADGGAVDLCGAMQCVDEGPMGATYDDDDDDDDDDAEYRAYMDELDVARRYLDGPSDSDDDDSDAFADEFVDFSDDDDAFDGDEELERAVRKRSIDIDDDAVKRLAADGSDDESSEDEPAPPPAKKKKSAAKKKKLAAKKGR